MKIAVSACLLGEQVRFDKGHKRDEFVMDELSRYAEFVSFCPEHFAFGSPRPSIRVVKNEQEELRIISNKTGEDVSETLVKTSMDDLEKVRANNVCGIIFKSKSPSCGMMSAKVYLENGFSEGKADGMFAGLCRKEFVLLPMEEEGRLLDPWLRENFVMQVFAYDSFESFKPHATMKDLVSFHQNNKFMLQSKDEVLYRELGRIVGNHEKKPFATLLEEYELGFKTAIAKKTSIGKTRNVLEHLAGFVKNFLSAQEKAMLHEQIEDYANFFRPLPKRVGTSLGYQKREIAPTYHGMWLFLSIVNVCNRVALSVCIWYYLKTQEEAVMQIINDIKPMQQTCLNK